MDIQQAILNVAQRVGYEKALNELLDCLQADSYSGGFKNAVIILSAPRPRAPKRKHRAKAA